MKPTTDELIKFYLESKSRDMEFGTCGAFNRLQGRLDVLEEIGRNSTLTQKTEIRKIKAVLG